MDNKRKRNSDDDGDHVQKRIIQPIVTEDANGTSSSEMTDCKVMLSMMPNGLPANCTRNPEQNPRVHRVRTGQSVQGEFSGNRTEIVVWDNNDPTTVHRSDIETAPTTTVNTFSSDDEMSDGDRVRQQQQQQQQNFAHPELDNHNMVVIELPSGDDIDIFINSYHSIENDENINETLLETCFGNPTGLIASTSIGQQQQMFAHPVLVGNQYDSLDIIELSSADDIYINFVVNSYNSIDNDEEMIDETHLETISEESINSIPDRVSIDEQQQRFFTMPDNYNLDVIDLTSEDDIIDLTSEDDIIDSNYSTENYEDIDESETISEESLNSIPLRISIAEQQHLSLLDSNNLDFIDLTSEDDGDTNLYYSSEHVDE